MISVTDLRKGVVFELDGEILRVLDYQHNKPGRGNAYIRTRVRNLRTGATLEKTFVSGDRVQDIRLDHHNVQYLYNDGSLYYFMDSETYEQISLSKELMADSVNYLVENMNIQIITYQGESLGIELPTTVDLEVIHAEPGVKGDTASAASKAVTLSTGLTLQVPLFVNLGDTIRVDTRDGSYVTRVQ